MLCERCHEREANIVIKEVVNGVVHEHNLCSACAQETELAQLFDDFPFGKLLSGILGLNGDDQTEDGSAAGAPQETMEDRLAVLRSRLQEAISEEEYEEAARYRDEIRKLQEEGIDA